MLKLITLVVPLLFLSGCCEVFGLCASVAVHTSIDSPQKVAKQQLYPAIKSDYGFGPETPLANTVACNATEQPVWR